MSARRRSPGVFRLDKRRGVVGTPAAGIHRRSTPQPSPGPPPLSNLQHSSPAGLSSPYQLRRAHLAAAAILNTSSRDRPDRYVEAGRRLPTRSPQQTSLRAPGMPGSHV
ncbi:hypothetical protein NDU88_007537 [Pleurodeles waltl]|uniref:Uncharacterized protein n=1 Tax=Pleurodeles waltl TaxID=8319 RepID=A0AAV7SSS4_PLEWA|nr:hypothetical protein NDU88_007537 [Pleurodeles waltl]